MADTIKIGCVISCCFGASHCGQSGYYIPLSCLSRMPSAGTTLEMGTPSLLVQGPTRGQTGQKKNITPAISQLSDDVCGHNITNGYLTLTVPVVSNAQRGYNVRNRYLIPAVSRADMWIKWQKEQQSLPSGASTLNARTTSKMAQRHNSTINQIPQLTLVASQHHCLCHPLSSVPRLSRPLCTQQGCNATASQLMPKGQDLP